jgi:hypothetical protein
MAKKYDNDQTTKSKASEELQSATTVELPDDPQAVTIEVPMGEVSLDSYLSRHVEVQLDQDQRHSLRRLLNGLRESGERLSSGRAVASNSDAVKWLLEQLGQ